MSTAATSGRAGATLFLLVAVPATLLLSAVAPAWSQTVVSLRAGANSTSLTGREGSKAGLNVGAGLTMELAGNLGLRLGASYSRKGLPTRSATSFNFDSTRDVVIETTFDYLEVPALLQITIPSSVAVSAHFLVGPVLGVRIGCELAQTTTTLSRFGEALEEEAFSDECVASPKPVDLGAMGGVGIDFDPSDNLTLTLDVLYNLGLTTIFQAGDAKNRTISIIAGVGFPVG